MNKKMILGIAIVAIFTLAMTACSGSGGGKTLNSPEALKEYLDSQPANGPDKPIKVSMAINEPMLKSVVNVINSANKYVSLNITGNLLTTIPYNAFGSCKMLVGITIPSSVTEIGEGAFFWCTSLASVTIPSSVTEIGYSAFQGSGLTSVTMPSSVTTIKEGTFSGCESLTSITIPSSVTSIEDYAFSGCKSLTSVTFEGTIAATSISGGGRNSQYSPFDGDLREKYLAGGIGTYTTTAPVERNSSKWTKQ